MTKEIDDGVIKFSFDLDKSHSIDESEILEIEKYRLQLYKLTLIGEYLPHEIGFGNLSYRWDDKEFLISGTQTGKFKNLTADQYSHVYFSDLNTMKVKAKGKIAPSSESLTHYAIYEACPQINYIFHIHHNGLWNYMLCGNYQKTKKDINYGTTEMADEAKRCIGQKINGLFVMTGHEDGIIAYGESAEKTMNIILNLIKESAIKL